MATLDIAGRKITVDDSFLKLSPADQQATVDEIASSFAAPPDKYQQAAIDERNTIFPKERSLSDLVTGGEGTAPTGDAGLTRRLVHGATVRSDRTLIASELAPISTLK